jgi:hypothetical protein
MYSLLYLTLTLAVSVCVTVGEEATPDVTPIPQVSLGQVYIEELHQSVILNCTSPEPNSTVQHWQLTDNSKLYPDGTNSNPKVTNNGSSLEIKDASLANLGSYACVVEKGDGELVNLTMSLDIRPRTTWELYRMNVIIGCAATAVCIVVLGAVVLIYHYRWRDPSEKDSETYRHDDFPRKMPHEYDYSGYNVNTDGETTRV